MDADTQSEDGEIKRTPEKDYFSEDEGTDTADSLEIKPPQVVVPHRKNTSYRQDKYLEQTKRQHDKQERSSGKSSRHHDRSRVEKSSRHREKHSGSISSSGSSRRYRHAEQTDNTRHSDPGKRERESSKHERKQRSTGDRAMGDLRERLLNKRRERREDPREYKMEYSSSSSSSCRDESQENRGERRDLHSNELRERREIRIEEQRNSSRHIRTVMETNDYPDMEVVEPNQRSTTIREKRHKRSHKHERTRDHEREKLEKEMAYREKLSREHQSREHHSREEQFREQHLREQQQLEQQEAMEAFDELERMEATVVSEQQLSTSSKDPKEMTEQELRRQRLLDAEREMARIKENSRLELEARRMKRGEKRQHSPDLGPHPHDPAVVDLSDESVGAIGTQSDVSSPKSNRSHASEGDRRETGNDQSPNDFTDSSSSTSNGDDDTEDDDSDDSNKSFNESNENSDFNNPSPLSVGQLAKSDRSEEESPGHVDFNGTGNAANANNADVELEEEVELPPYIPAIQGCRRVEEYKCLNRIEEGTYGVVYRAEDRRTKEIVALKRLKMEKEKDGFPITSLREINTLLKAQHPNIVTVREIVVGSNMDKIFIVMDYVEHDLKSLMETMKKKNHVFIPGEIKCLMKQLLKAVAHLHDNWIIHRDLKTSNLLLSHRGILKVGDFGLAREYGSPLKQYTSVVVTLWYRAPELLLGSKHYSTPIDIWSVGCIFAELLRMEALFPGKSEIELLNKIFKELGTPNDTTWPGYSELPLVKKIPFTHYPGNNLRRRFSLSLSNLGIDLLTKFLTYDPAKRITADQALKHSYFEESPLPIDPSMFPTWPAKSEFGGTRTMNASPKPPSGGKEFKQLSVNDDDGSTSGFHMGSSEVSRQNLFFCIRNMY